ncbi:signal peptidase II [Frankia sp. CNm7]|uniref:Lipoprotein signal peptidase n=1 Tax=Frankia nepalensis TaxID=1836974 RepID=A0A937RAZ1_9ACTN|nr:signal peptidase II [Frankia nepalensis]MBL7508671.1 signal peptidase II [Frankia nepalensis]MBL7522998.1 signal peptidase II [Frankia nepalensis]MBL7628833.1 signal peptidase II [Frankia nepalensis]
MAAGKATGPHTGPDAATRTDGAAGGVTRPGKDGEDRGGGTAPRGPLSRRPVHLLLATSLGVLLLDIITKIIVVEKLSGHAPVTLIPGVLDLRLIRNSGAAFSIGGGATVVFTVIACIVVAVIVRTARKLASSGWAVVLGAIVGGATGNLVDRLLRSPGPLRGHVVDWVHLHHWPIFNVADSAIVVAAVLAVILSALGVGLDGQRLTSQDSPGRAGAGEKSGLTEKAEVTAPSETSAGPAARE